MIAFYFYQGIKVTVSNYVPIKKFFCNCPSFQSLINYASIIIFLSRPNHNYHYYCFYYPQKFTYSSLHKVNLTPLCTIITANSFIVFIYLNGVDLFIASKKTNGNFSGGCVLVQSLIVAIKYLSLRFKILQ